MLSNLSNLFLAIAAIFALSAGIIGIIFLLSGMIKTVETLPHPACPKCRYNLTSLISDNCPECGIHIKNKNQRTFVSWDKPYLFWGATLTTLSIILFYWLASANL